MPLLNSRAEAEVENQSVGNLLENMKIIVSHINSAMIL